MLSLPLPLTVWWCLFVCLSFDLTSSLYRFTFTKWQLYIRFTISSMCVCVCSTDNRMWHLILVTNRSKLHSCIMFELKIADRIMNGANSKYSIRMWRMMVKWAWGVLGKLVSRRYWCEWSWVKAIEAMEWHRRFNARAKWQVHVIIALHARQTGKS